VEDNTTFQAAIRYATGIYYRRIVDAPTSAFIAARKVLSPGFYEPQPVSEHLRSSAPQKPYRQQSLLTKQRTRLTRLRTRLLSKTPLFFFEAYQETLPCDWTNDDDWQAIVGLAVENVRVAMGG
jgi:hypothetical protein